MVFVRVFCFLLLLLCSVIVRAQTAQPVSEGDTLFAQNKFSAAVTAYADAVHRNPAQAAPQIGRVRALIRLDQWQEALSAAQALAKAFPQNANASGLLALTLFRAGQPDDAALKAQQSLTLDPDNYWGLLATGQLAEWNGHNEDARQLFRRATRFLPDRPEAWEQMLETKPGSGEMDEQKKAADTFLALTPQGYPLQEMRQWLTERRTGDVTYWQSLENDALYTEEIAPASGTTGSGTRPDIQATVSYTIPFERKDNYIMLPLHINDQKFSLLFDTGGGNGILMGRKAVGRLHLKPKATASIGGVGGQEDAQQFRADTLHMGNLTWHTIPIEVVKDRNRFGQNSGQIGDGIFGSGLLRRYLVVLDEDASTMTLIRGAQATPPVPRSGNRVLTLPFHLNGPDIYLPLTLADHPLWALLDTGAFESIMSLRLAQQITAKLPKNLWWTHTDRAMNGIGVSSPWVEWIAVRSPLYLTLNQIPPVGIEIPHMVGDSSLDRQVSPDAEIETGMLLGSTELAAFSRITIDYPHRMLTLEYTPAPDEKH